MQENVFCSVQPFQWTSVLMEKVGSEMGPKGGGFKHGLSLAGSSRHKLTPRRKGEILEQEEGRGKKSQRPANEMKHALCVIPRLL